MQKHRHHWLVPIIVCSLGAFFYVYEFLLRVVPQAITQELMGHFNVHAAGLGVIASMFFYGYVPMQIPSGFLLDKLGPRLLLGLSVLLCAVATFLFGVTHSPILAGIMRFLMGMLASFAFVGALLLAAHWFHPKRYAFFTGIVQTMGCIGAIVGLAPTAYLTHHLGWHIANQVIAGIGLVFAILIALIVRNRPKGEKHLGQRSAHVRRKLSAVFLNPQTYWVALVGFAAWSPITIFATLWGAPFLMTLYHIPATTASIGSSLIWTGIAVGSPVIGWWSNHIGKRRAPIFLCLSLGLIASLLVIYGGALPYWLMATALLCFGIAASAQVITFGLVLDNTPKSLLGTASSFNNMVIVLGGVLLQPLVGILLTHLWNGQMHDHLPLYTVSNFHWALLMVPLCSLFGLIVTLFLVRETGCRPAH